MLHQRACEAGLLLSLPDCAGLVIVVNGGAPRQVDYKVTVNSPFQLCRVKLQVVFILYV